MRSCMAILVAALFLTPFHAANAQSGWTIVADDGRTAAVDFVEMSPGWHIMSRTDALIYQPARTLDGSFRAEYEVHVFPSQPSAAGVFFGGKGLEPGRYDYFEVLIDSQGRYRIGHRASNAYHEVVPWTPDEVIRVPTDQPAPNTMAVVVSPERLSVTINDKEVTAFVPPDYARFDGVAGLRIMSGLNVHVTRLEFTDTAP